MKTFLALSLLCASLFAAPVLGQAPAASTAADARYHQGLKLEKNGDNVAALEAFQEAGEAGHGLAQRKLGEIYDEGNSAVKRDYETAIKWFEKAREQGVPLAKQIVRP